MKNSGIAVIAVEAVLCLGLAAQPMASSPGQHKSSQNEKPLTGVDLIWAFKTPMRDGVHLNGTVFKPTA
jgi:hypothetical protein